MNQSDVQTLTSQLAVIALDNKDAQMTDASAVARNNDDTRLLDARGDDEFVFDEQGNLYLLDEVLMQILLNYK